MILVLRKTNLLLIILICALSYLTYSLYRQTGHNEAIPTFTLPMSNKAIIIDAGHGSPDGGASGSSGILEKDINLSISEKVQALIEQSGGVAIITRPDDNSIHDADKHTIRAKKNSDLKNRKNIIDESNADAFISIHLNKFEQSQYYGAQVFYSTNNTKSKKLGEFIQQELVEYIANDNNRKIKPATDDIFLLKKASIPAVVVECGFLSNPEEEKLLQTELYQKKLAWGIYIGAMKYFGAQ